MTRSVNIKFTVDNAYLFTKGVFSFKMEWTLPFLPRVGERLDSSILSWNIDPHSFYQELHEKHKIDWEKNVVESGVPFHQAVENELGGWCKAMDQLEVKDVRWCQDENGCSVEMLVKNMG